MNYVTFIYSFLIVNAFFKSVRSKCCDASWTTYKGDTYCADGKYLIGTYCSNGPCNIFGCNCDGGCITRDTSWIRGDIVGCRRVPSSFPSFPYIHAFIYAGNGRIIEVIPNKVNNGSMADQLNDGETDFCIVMNEMIFRQLRKSEYSFTRDRQTIIKRAESIVNENWPYSFLNDNCQHFISYVLTNDRLHKLPGLDVDQSGHIPSRGHIPMSQIARDNSAYPLIRA
ncbi:uncharacterized protein LOC114119961 [Aphis gossypii]|uniref:uncharacterized protein LOC114119961 n=1 Tax=Aphis gossypii TaxID=80765 RepID=UPI0021594C5C|nr:uncharacterized protein LOC114119961 [Aphis gossypii]